MEKKSWPEILEMVRTDETINFFARVATAWSAISVDVLMMQMQARGIHINAVIGIPPHPTLGNLIGPEHFLNSCSQYYIIEGSDEWKYMAEMSKGNSTKEYYKTVFRPNRSKNPIYYASFDFNTPPAVRANQFRFLGRDVIVCDFEEGFASYAGVFVHNYPDFSELKTLGDLRGYLRYTLMGKYFYKLYHRTFSSMTLRFTRKGLMLNKSIVPYYREVFRKRNELLKPALDRELLSHSIMLCTIGWRREELKTDDDLRVQRLVCKALKDKGYHIYLKSHPRDTFTPQYAEELGCDILEAPGLSMEGMCEFAQPLAVISFHSTTLVNPQIFWNIPTICISEMLDPSQISSRIQNEVVQFKHTFRNFVHFCQSADEVADTLATL